MAKLKKNTGRIVFFLFNTVAFSVVVSVMSALPSLLKNYTTLIPGSNIAYADTPHYDGGGDGGDGGGDSGADSGGDTGGDTAGGPGPGTCDDGPADGNGDGL